MLNSFRLLMKINNGKTKDPLDYTNSFLFIYWPYALSNNHFKWLNSGSWIFYLFIYLFITFFRIKLYFPNNLPFIIYNRTNSKSVTCMDYFETSVSDLKNNIKILHHNCNINVAILTWEYTLRKQATKYLVRCVLKYNLIILHALRSYNKTTNCSVKMTPRPCSCDGVSNKADESVSQQPTEQE